MKKHNIKVFVFAAILFPLVYKLFHTIILDVVFDEPCYSGKTKPCAYSSGIVGTKTCNAYSRWSECVPECPQEQ